MYGLRSEGDLFKSKDEEEENNRKKVAILYIDKSKENDLIQFISKTHQQGLNCLDLSKRNIKEIPVQLLQFTSLQYLYLEGNKLTQLPADLFLRLPRIIWLDLRYNQLVSIPNLGLAQHSSLQYLLLSGNRLRILPCELGKVKTLSALNLDGNPLDEPPFEIIKQGIKAIQQYLRDQLDSDLDSSNSSEEDPPPTPTFRSRPIFLRKSKSEMDYYETSQSNLLPAHLRSCIQYKRMNYSAIRPSTAMRSRPASDMRFPHVKAKSEMKNNNDLEIEQQLLMHLKHRDTKNNVEIQQLRSKTFITSKDYEEPMIHTPFHIDPHYISTMNNDLPNVIRHDQRRNHLTEAEEQRRIHDRRIQERIRQITDRMLRRRLLARSSTFDENRQVKLELRELRKLEFDTGQQQQQQNPRLKTPKKTN